MALTKVTGHVVKTDTNVHTHNINSSGIVTSIGLDVNGNADISGNLGVGGTLTYQDVTSIDAVGIITAQSGLHLGIGATAGKIDITTGISTFTNIGIGDSINHLGNTDTSIRFPSDDNISMEIAGTERFDLTSTTLSIHGNIRASDYVAHRTVDSLGVKFYNAGAGNNNTHVGLGAEDNGTSGGVNHKTFQVFRQGSSVNRVNIDASGNLNIVTGKLQINDIIEHIGDSNTKIRFPAADQFSVETGGSQRLLVQDAGAKVTGTLELTDSLYWDGDTDTTIDNAAGTANWIRFKTGGTTVMDITSTNDLKLHDNRRLKVGASDDIQIFHNSGNNRNYFYSPQNNVYHEFNVANSWTVQTSAGDKRIECPANSTSLAVELYHNGTKKFQTDKHGTITSGIATVTSAVINEDNAIHFRGTAADDLDAILRQSAGGGQLLINSRNDTILNIDSNGDSTDAHFAVGHGAATGSSTELFRVQEDGKTFVNKTSTSDHGKFEVKGGTADDIETADITAKTIATFSGSTPGTTAAGKGAGIVIKPIADRGCNYFIGVANDSSNQEAHGRFIIRSGNFAGQTVERLRIKADGKVGINDTNPSHQLSVIGTTSFYGVCKVGANNDISPSSGGTGQLIVDANGYTPYIAADGTAMYVGHNSSSRDLVLQTDETDRLTITGSAGNVGIGTQIPATWSGGKNLSIVANNGGQIELKKLSNDTRHYIWGNDDLNLGGGYTNGSSSNLRFLVNGNNERMRITSGGNVNVGGNYTQTAYMMQIAGDLLLQKAQNAYQHPQLEIYNSNNSAHGGSVKFSGHHNPTGGKFEEAVIKGYGGTGAGTGSLVIATGNGTDKFRLHSTGQLELKNGSFSSNLDCIMGNGGTLEIGAQSTMKFRTGTNERIQITSTGRIDIKGDSGSSGFTLSNKYGQAGFFGGMYYNGSSWVRNASSGRIGAGVVVYTGGHIAFLTSSENSGTTATMSERMRLSNGGTLSIGGLSPAISAVHGLEISNAATTEIRLKNTAGGNGSSDGFAIQKWSNGNTYLWEYDAQDLLIGTSNGERIRVDSGGNVGIGGWGANNIPQPLSVLGNIYQRQGDIITWNNGDCQIGGISGYHFVIKTYTGSSMEEKMRVTSNRGVLINSQTDTDISDVTALKLGGVFRHKTRNSAEIDHGFYAMQTGSGSYSSGYFHMKTDMATNSSAMFLITVKGYAYGAAKVVFCETCGYCYGSQNNIINTQQKSWDGTTEVTTYKSSDGYVVIRFTPGGWSSYYMGFWVTISQQNPAKSNLTHKVTASAIDSSSSYYA